MTVDKENEENTTKMESFIQKMNKAYFSDRATFQYGEKRNHKQNEVHQNNSITNHVIVDNACMPQIILC